MSDFREGGPSDYEEAVEDWAERRAEKKREMLADLWIWEQRLMHLSDSHSEYQDLRHWPIHRAIRWLVQKAMSPT